MNTVTQTPTDNNFDISQLTPEQIEQVMKEGKGIVEKKREQAKKAYEHQRDQAVISLLIEARQVMATLADFKEFTHQQMEIQANELKNYGKMNGRSQGGFSIVNTAGDMRVRRRRDTTPQWDERALKAVDLLKEFLMDKVKKRDQKVFEILMGYLEKNKQGDWEYSQAMEFIKHENKFQDERWLEGIRMLKESYSVSLKGFGYEFQFKNKENKWETLNLNFSSL
ncbi:DUF3164 family protein [Pedobacter zeae]|uniref:DUF3164 family protein n=1 Tax=Pedobacter zeae TaxID=1737356 RepID=A0A7W6K7J0_9SPHI|nr:DUF3164 family protein [Pedobacter zeae]MBB4106650.1 hypothetical protein [Pedobacter zeae]GGH02919.1 hypothetical protein GCM10007422_17660 [Pedobacter zeae]